MLNLYLGTFLISFAALLLQVSLTRVFAISQWYHFAFMAVSLSLLGFGASGSFLSVYPRLLRKSPHSYSSRYSMFFAVLAILSYLFINRLPFDSYKMALEPIQIVYFFLYYVCLSIPFFFAGLIISLMLTKFPHKANSIYFSSMAGSGLGAVSFLFIASFVPAPKIILASSFIAIIASLFFKFKKKELITALLTAYIILMAQHITPSWFDINMSPYKNLSMALKSSGSNLFKTRYNAQSRVDVIESNVVKFAPGLSYIYPKPIPKQLGITIDGQDLSAVTYVNRITKKTDFVDFMPSSAVFRLKKEPDILILNPRGGLEVLNALFHDVYSITVCEDNPIIVDLLKNDLDNFSGEIYNSKLVKLHTGGPRSFVKTSPDKFDIIDIPLTENFNIVVAGVYSLNENLLYTKEAIIDYLAKLKPGGMLVVTRWLQIPPSEELRLGLNIISALEESGVKSSWRNIVAIRSWMTATYFVKNGPFTAKELAQIKDFCGEKKYDIIYMPGVKRKDVNIYNVLPETYYYDAFIKLLNKNTRNDFVKTYQFDISATSDSKPFFFQFFKWSQLPLIIKNIGKQWLPFAGGGYLVIFLILIIALVSSILFILAPLLIWHREKTSSVLRTNFFLYFLFLGLGYMFIEIPLIQQFTLYLDYPVYSFSITLGSILFASGLGSLLSKKITSKSTFIMLLLFLPFQVITYVLYLPDLFNLFAIPSIIARIFISFALIFPIAFLMGIPFPLGIKLAGIKNNSLLPWLWAINGFSAVISSILAIIIATSWGYPWVFAFAGVSYLLSLVVLIPIFGQAERIALK